MMLNTLEGDQPMSRNIRHIGKHRVDRFVVKIFAGGAVGGFSLVENEGRPDFVEFGCT